MALGGGFGVVSLRGGVFEWWLWELAQTLLPTCPFPNLPLARAGGYSLPPTSWRGFGEIRARDPRLAAPRLLCAPLGASSSPLTFGIHHRDKHPTLH